MMVQSDTEWPDVRLQELGHDECWRLIASGAPGRIARVAWNTSSGPTILPVNYTVHDQQLWMRTSAYSSMARQVDDTQLAFETDEIDPTTHLGWSVIVHGIAEVIYHHEQVPDAVRTEHPWPSGHRPLWIRVREIELTGRRLSAPGSAG